MDNNVSESDIEASYFKKGINRLEEKPYCELPDNEVFNIKYERMGKPMPMAVVTGVDPSVLIVGATRTTPDIDEFHLAGALRGEPLEMVKCKTIDIEVPATSEWFGEYTGHYGEARNLPVFEIKLITHSTVEPARQRHIEP